MQKTNFKIQELCIVGLATALICVIAPFSLPMPLGVPMTLQSFIITLMAIILGAKRGATATLIYILLGAFGVPIFSNFTAGWQCLIGPTGGFILSFPIMAYIIGLSSSLFLGMFLGTVLNFACGIVMFCLVTDSTFTIGFTTCVLPFIPPTIIKWIFAYIIGIKVRKRITQIISK